MLVQQLLAHVAKVGHITCGTLPLARPRIFPRGTDGWRCHIATAVRTCCNPALHSTGWDVGKEKFGRARIEEVATSSGSADSSAWKSHEMHLICSLCLSLNLRATNMLLTSRILPNFVGRYHAIHGSRVKTNGRENTVNYF